jgi:D-glycero-D-manno-heptose 1,7-bisphosphate phosphatase
MLHFYAMNTTNLFLFEVNASWTLFLDRDGVINQRIVDGYVRNKEEFIFIDHVKEAIEICKKRFGKIIVVTNQQGIGKGLMNEEDLQQVHDFMCNGLDNAIDKVYYSPFMASENHPSRKPNGGMALRAKCDFPDIDFKKSIMVGDSYTDILFGQKLGMKTVYISETPHENIVADMYCASLYAFALTLK